MDISNTHPVSAHPVAGVSYIPPSPQPAQTPQADISGSNSSASGSSADIQAQYEATLHKAAQSLQETYPLGDQTFTLYKDITGQYITRYVSMVDGSITYVPEPVLVKQAASEGTSALSFDV